MPWIDSIFKGQQPNNKCSDSINGGTTLKLSSTTMPLRKQFIGKKQLPAIAGGGEALQADKIFLILFLFL